MPLRHNLPLPAIAVFGIASIGVLFGATASSRPCAAAEPLVTIENFTFKPAALTVRAGSRVTFKNVDDIPHSIVMADGSFHSKALDTDDMTDLTFATAGKFDYFCGLHPHMQGTITVVP